MLSGPASSVGASSGCGSATGFGSDWVSSVATSADAASSAETSSTATSSVEASSVATSSVATTSDGPSSLGASSAWGASGWASAAGCVSWTISRLSSSMSGSGAGQSVGGASASVSEWAPQPWSTLTTTPSSGDHWFAQTPKTVPSDPCSGTRNPQLPHAAADASDPALVGPCGPRYQRSAASSRPSGDSTRTRARASSSIATSSSSGSPVGVQPGSSRGSSALNGRTSPGPMSPGRMRSDHGSQAWPSTASGPGSSSASQTVAVRPRGTRATVTVHSQPR